MIKGVHAMFYTPEAEEVRAFIRDKLGFTNSDTGEGWLVFDLPEADMGVHPAEKSFQGLSFYCDDIRRTVTELKARGVEFTSDITEQPWGWLTHFRMPGDLQVELYQPKYRKATKAR